MKIAKACRECRLGKRKCLIDGPNGACSQCTRRNLVCSAVRSTRPRVRQPALLPDDAASSSYCDLDIETRITLVKLYMRLVHDQPHTLFHTPSLLQQVQSDSLAHRVLYGLLGIAARFSDNPSIRSRTQEFGARCRMELNRDIDKIHLDTVQACILYGNICGAEGTNNAESLYFGIALRMAQILRLTEPKAGDSVIMREMKLRAYWSLYMIDRWSSVGNGLPRQLEDGARYPLPMDEYQFKSLSGSVPESFISRPGLWGYMVRLAEIFCQIQDLHRHHVNPEFRDVDTEKITRKLAAELEQFIETLPPHVRLSDDNAKQYADRGFGSAFVALHLGYHHYATLLYFHYLDLQLEQGSVNTVFAARCRAHAAAYSDLLSLSKRIPRCDAVYFIVAHMTVVSSSALLHTLFFGQESELQHTRDRLKTNFETLVELRKYWPAVEQLMERLFSFQRACISTADPNTHKVDRWMVRFLLQHALPVSEKDAQDSGRTFRDKYADDAMAILRGEPKDRPS